MAVTEMTPEQREKHRIRTLRSRYGVELDLLFSLYEKQEGCCAICSTPGGNPALNKQERGGNKVLQVDHDHETGSIRGLLCFKCNNGLGLFLESAENLVSAANYVMKGCD